MFFYNAIVNNYGRGRFQIKSIFTMGKAWKDNQELKAIGLREVKTCELNSESANATPIDYFA